MITQEKFKEYIENYQEQMKLDNRISDGLEELCGCYVFFNCENKIYGDYLEVLAQAMNDKTDLISWWLFEDVQHKITSKDGKLEWDLKTVDDLYLYLTDRLEPVKLIKKERT
jgi:hypothetical protein